MSVVTSIVSHVSSNSDDNGRAVRDTEPSGDAHPLAGLLPRVRSRLADDAATGLLSVSDDEIGRLLAETEGLSAQVEALRLDLVDQARLRGLAKSAGAAATASWLAGTSGRHPAGCGRDVKLACTLSGGGFETTREALAAGRIAADQARVIADAVAGLPDEAGPDTRSAAQAHLLEQAGVFNAKDLATLARRILDVVDPDLAEQVLAKKLADDEAAAERARELSLSPDPTTGGLGTRIHGRLDPETADMLAQALDPLSKPRPTDADGPDTRTAAQRRGDGFAEILRRYLASGESPTSHGLAPQLVVTVTDHNLFTGTGIAKLLHTGAPISARTAERLACDAQISLLHPGGDSGNGDGMRLSTTTRLFNGRLRRLLELRDGGCAFPGCDRPSGWCEGHHIIPWESGGPTSLDNGVLLCGYHHRLTHRGEWTIRMAADGYPDFIPPDYIDPQQRALRNTRLRL